jgi:hypothetical protein
MVADIREVTVTDQDAALIKEGTLTMPAPIPTSRKA